MRKGRFVGSLVALGLAGALGTVQAQERGAGRSRGPAATAPLRGIPAVPDPGVSGEVKRVPVGDEGTDIDPAREVGRRERHVPDPDNVAATPPAPPSPAAAVATVPPGEVRRLFPSLRACRTEVASARGVAGKKVLAGAATVRFTVLPDGRTDGVEVVAEKATDPDVMSCVERKLQTTRFTPPVSGAVKVARSLKFR